MENETENSYNLSIRLSSNGFFLSVNDKSGTLITTKKVNAKIFTLTLDEIVRIITEETQLNYNEVSLICETDKYIFVPTPFFNPEEAAYFLNFQHKMDKKEQAAYNIIASWDTVNVFTVPTALKKALESLFPNSIITHHISWFLTNKLRLQLENSLSIWVRNKTMDVIVINNGKLQLLNSFDYQTPEDFTYHALNIIQQLSLDIDKCKVFLYNTDKKPELGIMLEKYVTVFQLT